MRLEVVWPLYPGHPLVDWPESVPYISCCQRLLWSPFAEHVEPEWAGVRVSAVSDYLILGTQILTDEWMMLRDVHAKIGLLGDMAILAHQLAVSSDRGYAERRKFVVTINGKPVTRWHYRRAQSQ